MEKKFNILIILADQDLTFSKYLFQNISKELFDLYLTANDKLLNNENNKACVELNINIENAITIESPLDPRLQNLDAIITVGVAF
jgi:hypothetical protein